MKNKKNKCIYNTQWQVAVVDRDNSFLTDMDKIREREFNCKDGTVLFIVSVDTRFAPRDSKESLYRVNYSDKPEIAYLATVYGPKMKRFGHMRTDMLRPILSKQDKKEMEDKFKINLDEYTSF